MQPLAFQADGLPSSGIAERKVSTADVVVGDIWGDQLKILLALIAGPRTTEDLMRVVYVEGRHIPHHAEKCIYVAVSRLRDKLKPGWWIGNLPAGRHGFSRTPQHYVLRRR